MYLYCCRGERITSGGRADDDDDQDWDDEGHDFDEVGDNDGDGGGVAKVVGEDGVGRYGIIGGVFYLYPALVLVCWTWKMVLGWGPCFCRLV